ncbi:hypothetical protein MPTK1_2g24220 [Marchantia polymorpha subsp. ruderalis]|uniref:Uncharacterized protein n=1 Tax=Marchantia polymorpha TaxID=3197 RepID=A0A2R6WPG3_MARPO|nr:hypothetical protein MARPO_0069s0071 [Marchantia polymorpha]BBN03528.1 hypothetical protein Mp_2g24220 [Marchantia polymorpha subsp. ruderalis]|eukprot:PTQ35734.1 hypothetical protein MARPO_0069s0071 [Marchantia polymorpha]
MEAKMKSGLGVLGFHRPWSSFFFLYLVKPFFCIAIRLLLHPFSLSSRAFLRRTSCVSSLMMQKEDFSG